MYSRYNILDSLLNLSSFLLLRGPFTSLLLFMYIFHLFFFNGTKHFLFIRRCHRDRVYRHRDRRQDAGKRKLEKREREREREREKTFQKVVNARSGSVSPSRDFRRLKVLFISLFSIFF